jgi:steroid 5-alpha reductase family enzyme
MWMISIPLLLAQVSALPQHITVLDVLGVAFWLVGFFFESVGDAQLVQFRKNPANKGRLLNTGVWHYTRHPNYFGDSAQWWGFYLIALASGGGWSIFSPVIMTLFLLKVSGVALLEKTLATPSPDMPNTWPQPALLFLVPQKEFRKGQSTMKAIRAISLLASLR